MVSIDLCELWEWQTPWWKDGVDKGGIVVSNIVEITIDAETILVASD